MDDHTTGPWTVAKHDQDVIVRLDDDDDTHETVIAEVLDKRDAHLVAAAPDLLSAAKFAFLERLAFDRIDDGITQALRAAIAKAEKDPTDG
jgi:hypothetical protein